MITLCRGKCRMSFVVAVTGLTAWVLVTSQIGCESAAMRTIRGARHYAEGTDALTLNRGAVAIAELERAAVLVPHASEIRNHLGLAYWSQGRVIAARTAFERAIELDCDNVVARGNLERLTRSGELGTATKVVETARVNDSGE